MAANGSLRPLGNCWTRTPAGKDGINPATAALLLGVCLATRGGLLPKGVAEGDGFGVIGEATGVGLGVLWLPCSVLSSPMVQLPMNRVSIPSSVINETRRMTSPPTFYQKTSQRLPQLATKSISRSLSTSNYFSILHRDLWSELNHYLQPLSLVTEVISPFYAPTYLPIYLCLG